MYIRQMEFGDMKKCILRWHRLWKDFVSGMTGRTCGGVIHAGRRSVELMMAAEMLEEDGLSSGVCRASAEKLKEIGELNLKDKLGDYRPKTWKEAVQCVMDAKAGK